MTHQRHGGRFDQLFVALIAIGIAWPAVGRADEHAEHHGGGISVPAAGGASGHMGEMGRPPRQELYPSLMNLPALTPAERDEMQRLAHQRMQSGVGLLSSGLSALSEALDRDDYAAMQTATGDMREGLKQFEDSLAAHRALAEGRRPEGIALNWFKQNLDLARPARHHEWTVLGLSPMHAFIMLVLFAFAVTAIGLYFFKMRRAAALLARLTSAPPTGTPPPAPPGASPTPVAPSSNASPKSVAAPPRTGTTRWAGLLRVARIMRETPNVKTFRLVAPDGGPIPFTFLPGQFLNLALTLDGKLVRRSFTIASSPLERRWLELTIKREEDGLVSRHFHDKLREGDTLQVHAPFGAFIFTGQEADSIVLIAAGVGVTPVMTVLRYLVATQWTREIYFLYCVRSPTDVIFHDEIELLAQRRPNLHVTLTVSRPDESWKGVTGRLTKDMIATAVPDLARRRIHLCGPPAMMEATKALLLELGVLASQIKTEDFGSTAPTPAPVIVPPLPVAAVAGPKVDFTRSHKTTSMFGCTVLEASEAVAVDIPWSCRVGTCGVCKSHLVSGDVTMAVEDGLEPGDRERGMILACQARTTSDIAVEA